MGHPLRLVGRAALGALLLTGLVAARQGRAPAAGAGSTSDPQGVPVAPATQGPSTQGARAPGGQGSAPGPNFSREAMWPAPTAEDWKRPCLIQWQRTWEDALDVAKRTGKPILICVNMDGEIASEHWAGVRYREAERARLFEPYVCVIASVYRHNPRDFDDEGNRIECPRFGGVTCGEHIAIEPLLFDTYFEDRRVAPRHIMVELDRREVYDVYYAWDTDTIFTALREGVESRPPGVDLASHDAPLLDRTASRDAVDRTAVEQAYRRADRAQRRALIESAMSHRDVDQVDLLRLALFGLDRDLARLAREALAQSQDEAAIDLIAEALRVPMEDAERDVLLAALDRLGAQFPRARSLATVFQGLAKPSTALDAQDWSRALEGREPATRTVREDRALVESRLEYLDNASARADAASQVELAEAFLLRAFASPEAGDGLGIDAPAQRAGASVALGRRGAAAEREMSRWLLSDARRTALAAEQAGARGWRLDAVLALTAGYGGDDDEARTRAERAVASLPAGEPSWTAMAVLELLAKLRWGAISKAARNKESWPAEWLTDLNAACDVLERHPYGTAEQVAWHHDILKYLKANAEAQRALDAGLERFADAPVLHERLRAWLLRERGVEGLEAAYRERAERLGATPELRWYAAYASVVAAEFRRRWSGDSGAREAYERALTQFTAIAAAAPELAASSDHWSALALAGQARLAFEGGDDAAALSLILASFARSPASAATLDGLNLSPVSTARALQARLLANQRTEEAARVTAALEALDPSLLLPAEFDRDPNNAPSPDAVRAGRGGRAPR